MEGGVLGNYEHFWVESSTCIRSCCLFVCPTFVFVLLTFKDEIINKTSIVIVLCIWKHDSECRLKRLYE